MSEATSLLWRQKLAEARQRRVEVMKTVERSFEELRILRSRPEVLAHSDVGCDELAKHPGEPNVAAVKGAQLRLEFLVHGGTVARLVLGVNVENRTRGSTA